MSLTLIKQDICPIGQLVGAATLGVAILAGMAALPGCGSSSEGHAPDPAGAAKTLVGDPPPRPAKPAANKKLQKLIDEEAKDLAKHPKVR